MPIEFGPLESVDTEAVADGALRLTVQGLGIPLADDEAIGIGGLSLLGNGDTFEEGELPDVIIPTAGDGAPVIYGEGFAWLDVTCEADGGVGTLGNGFAALNLIAGDMPAISDTALGLQLVGYEYTPPQAYAILIEQAGYVSSYGGIWLMRVTDQADFGEILNRLPTMFARSAVALGGDPYSTFDGNKAASSTAVFNEDAAYVVRMLMSEGVVFSDLPTATFTQIGRVLSLLIVSGQASNYAEAYALVLDALVMGALADAMQKGDIVDSVALNAAVTPFYTLVVQLLERLLANAATTAHYTLTALIEERVLLNLDLSHAADLAALLRDSVSFAVTLGFDNGEYIAWTLNTESTSLSRYTNYPFNSFAKIGGRYYGAASDGIHLLDGDDDNEVPIAAKLRLGLDQLGDRKLKRLPEVFIGYSSDGTLLMKVITIDERTANKKAAIYTLPTRGAANIRDHKIEPGKGLCSVDWDFEIHNVDGSDFDLKSIEFYPLIMARRTRG